MTAVDDGYEVWESTVWPAVSDAWVRNRGEHCTLAPPAAADHVNSLSQSGMVAAAILVVAGMLCGVW